MSDTCHFIQSERSSHTLCGRRMARRETLASKSWDDVDCTHCINARDAQRYVALRNISYADKDVSFDAYDAEGMDAELDRRIRERPELASRNYEPKPEEE